MRTRARIAWSGTLASSFRYVCKSLSDEIYILSHAFTALISSLVGTRRSFCPFFMLPRWPACVVGLERLDGLRAVFTLDFRAQAVFACVRKPAHALRACLTLRCFLFFWCLHLRLYVSCCCVVVFAYPVCVCVGYIAVLCCMCMLCSKRPRLVRSTCSGWISGPRHGCRCAIGVVPHTDTNTHAAQPRHTLNMPAVVVLCTRCWD